MNDEQHFESFLEYGKTLSPFELKNALIDMARATEKLGTYTLLNAGRGNPNWTASTPREAFFTLGQFAIGETRRIMAEGALAGIPYKKGIAERFYKYVERNQNLPGIFLLKEIVDYGIQVHEFEPDDWVYEMVDGIIGDHYPIPDRMLKHTETVVCTYLMKEMGGMTSETKDYDLFAVEGGTAAMCYIFDTLIANHLLTKRDHVAVMVPIFTPYLEIPELSRYEFQVTFIHADELNEEGRHTWQYSKGELNKLRNTDIKALFVVNPSNPPSVAIDTVGMDYLKEIIEESNPELMIITDDVYGTFAEDFQSLMTKIPYHTIGVYSFSKYFGVTGWRLGVIAMYHENIFEKLLGKLSTVNREDVMSRYQTMVENPSKLKFIDRIVADSRQVALNHTAGLSTPQQIQMMIFSAFALLDTEEKYKEQTKAICHRRLKLLYKNLDLPYYLQEHSTAYYRQIDLLVWARLAHGQAFVSYLISHYEPLDMLYHLAKDYAIVLLNGNGFKGPDWSIRVSLANLPDEAYEMIGKAINSIFQSYVESWKKDKKKASKQVAD
ncbi:MAG: aspartate 4-decarboxylase [Cellulosilyticum sp.]|nr:aspartate 4-decarboxylase [Cellulosilyticum sp.]